MQYLRLPPTTCRIALIAAVLCGNPASLYAKPCEVACKRLHDLAWRRLYGKEMSKRQPPALARKRALAKDRGAMASCLRECRRKKIDPRCVIRATGVGIAKRVIEKGAPGCFRGTKKAAASAHLFDMAVLATEAKTAVGSCINLQTGICTDFVAASRYGAIAKGAACRVLAGGTLQPKKCPRARRLGTCVFSRERQRQHFYFTESSNKAERSAFIQRMRDSCAMLKGTWLPSPSK